MSAEPTPDAAALGPEVRRIWDANAAYWDQGMGEGNEFHKALIEPTQLRLLDVRPGDTVLDVACGNGQFARKLADAGAKVLAMDVAPQMLEHARARSGAYAERITYQVLDACDEGQLLALGERRFEHVVCTMAIMDMCQLEPLVAAAARLLKPSGRFVFSILHPCFNSGMCKLGHERHDLGGKLVDEYYVRIVDYLGTSVTTGLALPGQPAPQYYFHRPLSVLFNACFAAGFVLDGLEEPSFPPPASEDRLFLKVFAENPPALVARFRAAGE